MEHHEIEGNVNVDISAEAELNFTSYPNILLETCQDLIDNQQYGISVVVAHMACEVATERAFSKGFNGELQHLEKPIVDFMNGFSLGNARNRSLYNALTGDYIEAQPFWSDFKVSSKRRNSIIHNGSSCSESEAKSSYLAAKAFINYLNQ